MRAVVDMAALGERTVIIDCDVIQADGGTRTASITGAFVALALALRQLVRVRRAARRMPLRDYVAATSVGLVGGVPMLDLCYEEDSQADVDMNVVMTGAGQFVEVQATAEHTPFDDAQMAQLLDTGARRHRAAGGDAAEGDRRLDQALLRHRATRASCANSAWRRTARRSRSSCCPASSELRPCVEDGATFEENAIKKALHYGRTSPACCSRTIPAWRWTRWAARPASTRRASPGPQPPTKPTTACCWKNCAAWPTARRASSA